MKTDKPDKNLFVETGSLSDVVLNWFGAPTQKIGSYAEAYHSAARRLFEKSSDAELRDDYAGPIVFLYRHSLELYLKEILINGNKILELDTNPFETQATILNMRHDLVSLWDALKRLHKGLGWTWEAHLDAQGEIIKTFNTLDQISICFRYPIKKTGDPALSQNFRFDLRHFCDRMDEVLKTLDSISCGIAGMIDRMTGNEM